MKEYIIKTLNKLNQLTTEHYKYLLDIHTR